MAEDKELEQKEHGERWRMKPWEQHSAVISIPRFDYNAPASLLHHSHSGFLVTCPISNKLELKFENFILFSEREKSATKEAISILEKCTGLFRIGSSESLESSGANIIAKRRKTCMGEVDGECPSNIECKNAAANCGDSGGKLLEDSCLSSAKSDTTVESSPSLSLVKLTRSGLVLFTILANHSPDVVDIVSKIICSPESGSLSSPLWCHRIFPIQATCCLNEKELHATVSKLVIQFVNDKRNKLARPVKFAVGYNRRGFEETEMEILRKISGDSEGLALLDRNKCFSIVAVAVKDAVSDSVVDLRCPELSVLVEMLPISGLPSGSLVVAVSVLPCNIVTTKPRLCIKALVSDNKARNDRKNH